MYVNHDETLIAIKLNLTTFYKQTGRNMLPVMASVRPSVNFFVSG